MGHWGAGPCRETSEGGQPWFLTIASVPITSSHLRGREEAWLGEVWKEEADLDHPGGRQRLASSETIAYACQDPPPALTPKSGYTNIPELWTGRLVWDGLGWAAGGI